MPSTISAGTSAGTTLPAWANACVTKWDEVKTAEETK